MDIKRRDELYDEIVELDKAGDREGVIDRSLLIADLNIPDLEKCVALGNVAIVYGQLKNVEKALHYFDRAIKLEAKHNRYAWLERKAALLAEHGRTEESLGIYRELKNRGDLFIADFQRYAHNVEVLEQNLKDQNG